MQPSLPLRLMSLIFSLALLASLPACGDASRKSLAAAPPPRTTAVYTLAPRQTVELGPNASVTLDHVNDSRCQPGKVCVWAGYLSYSLTLRGPAGETSFVLADAMPGVPRATTLQGLSFALENNDDETATAASPAARDYRLSFRVTVAATQTVARLATRPSDLHAN